MARAHTSQHSRQTARDLAGILRGHLATRDTHPLGTPPVGWTEQPRRETPPPREKTADERAVEAARARMAEWREATRDPKTTAAGLWFAQQQRARIAKQEG